MNLPETAFAGLTTSLVSDRVKVALRPSTWTEVTARPSRSTEKEESFFLALAFRVVVAAIDPPVR